MSTQTRSAVGAIPTVTDLRSDALEHRFGDLWNPPGLTNFLGCAQADLDPVAVRSISFPPLATGDLVTGTLFLDDRLFSALGVPLSTTWQPDRVERLAWWDGLSVSTTTVVPVGRTAVLVRLSISNWTEEGRVLPVRLALRSAVTRSLARWTEPYPPCEQDNEVRIDAARRAQVWTARGSDAVMVQGGYPLADTVDEHGLRWSPVVPAAGTWTADFVIALGEDEGSALACYDALAPHGGGGEISRCEQMWDAELEAVFTPGNDRYSGSLPVLETSDPALRRLWLAGVIGVVYFKRENPYSVMGRTYDTLMPRYWQSLTFLWDYSLSAQVHALLDPEVMRRYLEKWITTDVHTHMGSANVVAPPGASGAELLLGYTDFSTTALQHGYDMVSFALVR